MSPEALAQLLPHAEYSGVFHLSSTPRQTVASAAKMGGLSFQDVALGDEPDPMRLLDILGKRCGFPEWYGGNFDALHDCLTDLNWQDTGATVLLFSGVDGLRAASPEAWETLLEVLQSVAEYWKTEDTPFWVFIDMKGNGLAAMPTVV